MRVFSYHPVELGSFENEELAVRLDDAALDSDGTSGVDVVSRHHADGDTGTLTLAYCYGNLQHLNHFSL